MIYEYYSTCTILSYENDLELFVEILDAMLKIMEENEEYEKCQVLQNKKQKCLDMSLNKTI